MADNVTVDNGALTDYTVASDEDASGQHQYVKLEFGGDGTFTKVASANPLPVTTTSTVLSPGADTLATARVTVTTTSGEAVAARAARTRVTLLAHPNNTDIIDIGVSGVSAGAGFPLYPGDTITLNTAAAIHADAVSGSQTLVYIEEFDS